LGDITCPDNDLEASQAALANCVKEILRQGDFPVLLGGGHDIAYAHYRGVSQTFPDKRIGFINFDAHFDLRPDDQGPSSGTPFYQLFREALAEGRHFAYLPLGIQLAASPPSLLKTADKFGVDFKVAGEITLDSKEKNIEYLDAFLADLDGICLTIDLDGFASAYAPGVSAPSALGFSPGAVFPLIDHLAQSGKLISLDVAELNPTYDQDNVTAKLAARCIETVVRNLR
jgi:formiminoglutamase